MDARVRVFVCLALLFFCFILKLPGQDEEQGDTSLEEGLETVFLKVAVSDPLDRYVTGLKKEHFKVFEDKIEQEIVHFNTDATPISVGIILDISKSMKEKVNIKAAIEGIKRIQKISDSEDEYFLITFNQTAKLVRDFSQQVPSLPEEEVFEKPGNDTTLYDAVYLGLSHIMDGTYDTRLLILITYGKEKGSRHSISEVREFAKKSDVQIYSIGPLEESGNGRSFIKKIVNITGGRVFLPKNLNELGSFMNSIHAQSHNQYILGYRPTNQAHDGEWRKFKVKLAPPPKLPKLKVHVREGYYAHKY